MSVIPSRDRGTQASLWPNLQTCAVVGTVGITVGAWAANAPDVTLFVVCGVARAGSMYIAYAGKRDVYKLVSDVAAYAALFLPSPYNIAVSAGIDAVAEAKNYWANSSPHRQGYENISDESRVREGRLDPSILANAYTILDIPEESRENLEAVSKRHNIVARDLERRVERAVGTLKTQLEEILVDVQTAYTTISDHLNGEPKSE